MRLVHDDRPVTGRRVLHRLRFEATRAAKRLRRAAAPSPADAVKTVAFILGCQRSGTTALSEVFALDPDSDVYPERSALGRRDDPGRLRLRALDEVADRIARNPAPLVVAKPLVESQRATEILGHDPSWKVIWMYRDHRDVARSNQAMFGGDNGHADLASIVGNLGDWRDEGVPAGDREVIRALTDAASGPVGRNDAAALFWWARNRAFFRQGLEGMLGQDGRVWLCRYDDFVTDPRREMHEIYRFLGRAPSTDFAGTRIHTGSIGRGRDVELSDRVAELCDALLERLDGARRTMREGRRTAT